MLLDRRNFLAHEASTSEEGDEVVIDGQAFRAPPVARVRIPARVPYGFHRTRILARY